MIKLSNLLTEADEKQFTNPVLNKKIKYTDKDGKQKENIVGNLLRLAKNSPGRLAAEKMLPKPGSPERKSLNRTLGREKDGKTIKTADNTKRKGDTQPEKPSAPEKPAQQPQQTAQLFTKDPAMAARMGKEKETQAKIAGEHPHDGGSAGWRKNAKVALTNPKAYARAIKNGIKHWNEQEKEFFTNKVHKGNSPVRRSWGEALKHKAVGAWHAIQKGAKHEVHTFHTAGKGIKNWFSGNEVSDEEQKAIKDVVKKVVIAGAMGVATGGLAHGALAFSQHLMAEFVPHLVAETMVVGVAKAALHAGDSDVNEDKAIQAFMDAIADKLANEDVPPEILAKAIETYNAQKGESEITQNEAKLAVNQLQQLVKESIIR